MGERQSDEELRREDEADRAYCRDMRLKADLSDILLAALSKGPDAAFLVQRVLASIARNPPLSACTSMTTTIDLDAGDVSRYCQECEVLRISQWPSPAPLSQTAEFP